MALLTAWRARPAAREPANRLATLPDLPGWEPLPELFRRDLAVLLDEEVPRKYRVPFVLCYLEGKTNKQAARLLGCPVGTVSVQLWQARERLRTRLTRRGLALSSELLADVSTRTVNPLYRV
jgi:HlyD family secretion protein